MKSPAGNIGFCASVAGQTNIGIANPSCGSGQDKQLWTLVLNFNISFSISSGCGRTEY
jgi:hypothetical protein